MPLPTCPHWAVDYTADNPKAIDTVLAPVSRAGRLKSHRGCPWHAQFFHSVVMLLEMKREFLESEEN